MKRNKQNELDWMGIIEGVQSIAMLTGRLSAPKMPIYQNPEFDKVRLHNDFIKISQDFKIATDREVKELVKK